MADSVDKNDVDAPRKTVGQIAVQRPVVASHRLEPDDDHDEEEWPEGWPTPEELRARGFVRLSQPKDEITSRPRVGQYYWVDFPCDAWKPEFFEMHPGVVIRAAKKARDDTCVIVPVSSTEPSTNPHAVELSVNPNPFGQRDGVRVWAVCDHIYTVHVNRLRLMRDLRGSKGWQQVKEEDLKAIFAGIRKALSRVLEETSPAAPSTAQTSNPTAPATPSRPLGPNTLTLKGKISGV